MRRRSVVRRRGVMRIAWSWRSWAVSAQSACWALLMCEGIGVLSGNGGLARWGGERGAPARRCLAGVGDEQSARRRDGRCWREQMQNYSIARDWSAAGHFYTPVSPPCNHHVAGGALLAPRAPRRGRSRSWSARWIGEVDRRGGSARVRRRGGGFFFRYHVEKQHLFRAAHGIPSMERAVHVDMAGLYAYVETAMMVRADFCVQKSHMVPSAATQTTRRGELWRRPTHSGSDMA